MKARRFLVLFSIFMIGVLIATACAGPAQQETSAPAAVAEAAGEDAHDEEEVHQEGDEHAADEHTEG